MVLLFSKSTQMSQTNGKTNGTKILNNKASRSQQIKSFYITSVRIYLY